MDDIERGCKLEAMIFDLAAQEGTRRWLLEHGEHSKMVRYCYDTPMIQSLLVDLDILLNIKPTPPSINDNTWWMFMICAPRVPKDIMKMLYRYYVNAQYPKGYNRVQFSGCIHHKCSAVARYRIFVSSKLRYEQWLNTHMLKYHRISMWDYMDRNINCKHDRTTTQTRIINGIERICLQCGIVIESKTEWR
jgi:hypothetical protein